MKSFGLFFCMIAVVYAYVPIVEVQFSMDDGIKMDHAFVAYGEYYTPVSYGKEYILVVWLDNKTIYETTFDKPTDIFWYDGVSGGFAEEVSTPAVFILPFLSHNESIEIRHEGQTLFITSLSIVCNDNKKCDESENHLSCPGDCPSGGQDNFCDRKEDGICDPDCFSSADFDCERKSDEIVSVAEAAANKTLYEGPRYSDAFILSPIEILILVAIALFGIYLCVMALLAIINFLCRKFKGS